MVLNIHKRHKAYWGVEEGGMDEGEEGDVCEFSVDVYKNIFITESV